MRCPVGMKLNNLAEVLRINENDPSDKQTTYFQKTRDGKQILRDVMARHISTETVEAEKQGFSSPDASWFRGESIDFVRHRLVDGDAAIYSVLDRNAVVPLIEEHLRGERNRRLLIWSVLNVDRYLAEVFG